MIRGIVIRCGLLAAFVLFFLTIFSKGSVSFGAPPNPPQTAGAATPWVAPAPSTLPAGPLGDSIRLGMNMFNDTPKYAEKYVGNKMSCTHCHVDRGTVAYGIPM